MSAVGKAEHTLPSTAVVALVTALCAALTGCGGHKLVRVPMVKPAEVNLAAYPSLGVTQLTGDHEGALAALIEGKLVDGGRFQVVDRTHTNQVMNELRLSASDLAQGNNAIKLGGLVTAGALISGAVDERYRDIPKSRTWRDKGGVDHTDNWVEGEAAVRASLKVIDVSTGRLVFSRTFEAKEATGFSAKKGGFGMALLGALADAAGPLDHRPPDRHKLTSDAREKVAQEFVASIAPQKEMVEVAFATDDKIPQLQSGIGWAQRGEWKKAQGVFNDGLKAAENNPAIESKVLAKCYLDLGLSHALAGEHAEGIRLLSKAYDLSADPAMLDEVDFAKKLQADAKRLGEQTAPPPAN